MSGDKMKPLTPEQEQRIAYTTDRMCFRQVLEDGRKIHGCDKYIVVRPDGTNVTDPLEQYRTEIREYTVIEGSDVSDAGDIIDGDLRVLIMYCD